MAGTSQPALKVIDGGQKDRRALLRELYSAHGGSVYGRCLHLLKDATKAEDALVEVFARALLLTGEPHPEASPREELMKLATQHCLDPRRAEQAPWRRWMERNEVPPEEAEEGKRSPGTEQALFEAKVPFERFAAGVEKALEAQPAVASRPRLNGFLVAVAVTVLLAVAIRPLLSREPSQRLEGGATAELRIGDARRLRPVAPGTTEALAPGERVRLGYTSGAYQYVLAVSVDEAGEVRALYPEEGTSLRVEPGAGTHWLPDSVELTGSGLERVVVLLSREPLEVEAVRSAARRAWEGGGRSVAALPSLNVGGGETHWVLRKP